MPSAQNSAEFAGPLAYSCSNAQGVAVTVDAVYGVLSGSQLKLFDEQPQNPGPSASLAQPTSISVITLAEYATCLAGPAQQGLTWELTLQRRRTGKATGSEQHCQQESSHPHDTRRKSTVAGLENKKNWLKSKLRSKSISTSASTSSLAALAQDDPPPPIPSMSAAIPSANTPTRRLSIHTPARFSRNNSANAASSSSAVTPNKGSVILSTISRDMQQRWIAAISAAIASNAAPVLSPSASSPSSLANLAAYKMPRMQSPSPLTVTTPASQDQSSSSFLNIEPPSPHLYTFQENAGESKHIDRRSSSPVNPFLPQWLADVRSATNKSGESTSRSFGMRPSRSSNALLSKAAGAGDASVVSIAISHHEESANTSSKGARQTKLAQRPSTANTLSPPFLRPQRSSSSLSSSSRLDDSVCSTAPSTNPPTPKAFNDSPPTNRQTLCFGEKGASSSKGGWRKGFGFSSSDEEGRTSLGSLTSATSDLSTTTASTAFETPRRHGSDGDTAPIGSHIMEPSELQRRMKERGVLLDARPSTATGNIGDLRTHKSTFGPGARLPAAPVPMSGEKGIPPHHQYTKPEGLDVQALFAALPPPKKRTNQLSGMKTSSSSGSINSLARTRAVATVTSPSSNSSPLHSPLAL